MRTALSTGRTRSRPLTRSAYLLLAALGASLAAGLAPAAAGAATLLAPQNRLIAPGAAVGFPGSLEPKKSGYKIEVTKQGGGATSEEEFKLLDWQESGVIVRVGEKVAPGTYEIKATDTSASEPIPFTVTAPSVAGQTFTMLSTPEHSSLPLGVAQGPSGETWFSDAASNSIGELTSTGSVVEYPLATAHSDPTGIAVDQAGNVWVTDNGTGQVTELEVAHASPGTSNGESAFALAAEAHPDQLSVDPYGNVWVAEGDGVLGEIVAGSHAVREWLIGGDLEGMVVDAFGNVWAVDESSGVVQIVPSQLPAPSTATAATSGVYHVAGSGGTEQIAASPNGDIWFTQWGPPVLGVVAPSTSNPAEDRAGFAANYPQPPGGAPSGVGVDAAGHVFVEDAEAQSIFEFTPSGEPGAGGEVPGTWKEYPAGSWITNYAEGDEGNNLAVLPSGNVVFSGYVMSILTHGGTPYEPTELIQGYLGTLPGVATPATALGRLISGGITTEEVVSGTAGDEVVIPAGTEVKTSAGTPFTGTVPPPAGDKSLVPGGSALFGDLVPGSAFSVSPELSDGVLTHLTFSKCVTVVYSFPLPSGVTAKEAEEAKLYYYNFSSLTWEEAGTECGSPGGKTTVSGSTVRITLLTEHLSAFAAFHHPPAPAPPTAPPKKKHVRVDRKTGEIEAEYEFPETGEAEAFGEVAKRATLARVQHAELAAVQSQQALAQTAAKHKHRKHKKGKKCKRGFVKRHRRCVSNAPLRYGRVTVKVTKAGAYKIRVKPAGKVRAALRKGRTVHVSFVLVFTPSATSDHIRESAPVSLHLKKKHKHRKGKHKKGK